MALLRIITVIAIALIALPVALVAGLLGRKGRRCSPQELAQELRQLSEGDMSGWDEFECVPIQDPRLEAIRREAMQVELPLRRSDRVKLAELANRAEALPPQA